MPRPYLSLAIRTDAPTSMAARHVRTLFDALLQHLLIEQLNFVDPLQVAPGLIEKEQADWSQKDTVGMG